MGKLLYRIGSLTARHPSRTILAWLAIAAGVIAAAGAWGGEPTNSFDIPGAESQRAAELIEDRFPGLTGTTSRIVFHAEDGRLDDPATAETIASTVRRVGFLDDVGGVTDPFDPRTRALSADGETAYATIDYSVRFDELTPEHLEAVRTATSPAVSHGVQVEIGGAVADFGDGDTEGNESFGLGVALIVLLIALGSVAAALLPIGLALFALAVGAGLLGLLAAVGAVPEDTTALATMIGLGVGIDYALFVVTRYRQLVSEGRIRADAIARANATAGQAVVLAGTTVLVAIAGLRASGLPAIAMMGYGTAIVVAVSVLAAVTLLPALLGAVGHRIDGLFARTRRRRRATIDRPVSATAAGRWANHIGSHPIRYAVASFVLLATLALPLGALRIGFSDAGAESTERTTRRAYDLLADAFGPGFNGPLLAVADLRSSDDPEQSVAELEAALVAADGIQGVSPPLISADGDAVIVTAIPEWSPQDEATATLVDTLRDDVLPAVDADTGATVLLGGSVAGFADVSQQLRARLPWFIGAVVAISVLLLTVVFRSVVVPLKAAAMNLLSIGAAYGVVVAVFQWGWGSSLVGVDESVPINPFVPMMMFAILFGLSMDYEVFLLSRIREEYVRSGDNHASVVAGLGATARVITSAALIMIAVFGGFVANPVTFMKMIGLGLSVAVLLDATVIRMVLVPSTMALMGRANWWLPSWLDRVLPHVDIDSPSDEPAEEPAELLAA
jgi:RND superfamily putative drug exporter